MLNVILRSILVSRASLPLIYATSRGRFLHTVVDLSSRPLDVLRQWLIILNNKENTTTSKFVSLAAVATAGIILATPAFAGEVDGNGRSTPIRDFIAAICSFSGLEDGDGAGAPSGPGVTQTPHAVEGTSPPPGAAAICAFLNPGNKPE